MNIHNGLVLLAVYLLGFAVFAVFVRFPEDKPGTLRERLFIGLLWFSFWWELCRANKRQWK